MQQIMNVLTPTTSTDLVTLDEMKMKLNVPPTNTNYDALIQEIITNTSEVIATMCNRVFGYQEVEERFYQLEDETTPATRRLYLSQWPVVLADIQSFTQNGSDLLAAYNIDWILEQKTGTLYRHPPAGPWYGELDLVYSGGYQLPDDAPNSLKFAVEAVVREGYATWIRDPSLFMVNSLSHKESRIHYFAPNLFSAVGLPGTWDQLKSMILTKYTRNWV